MPKLLAPRQIAQYREQGYLSPLSAFAEHEALRYRALLEQGERTHGLTDDRRRKMYLYLKWADEVVRQPRILDAVEDLIGPNILVYHLTLWLKEPRSEAFISWHQDSTYFGLSPAEHVTAWVALSPSTLESGCVQVAPGSHLCGQIAHGVARHAANLFPTGQVAELPDHAALDTLVLAPGEFSLHHTHLLHNSMPNHSADRRIGLGISYIPTHCRCSARQRLSVTLVRGEDRFGHFDHDPAPVADYDAAAVAVHASAIARWYAARAQLIPEAHGQAA